MDKRILIIANDALADTSSNGRTLKNLLMDIPKEYLAQIYIHGTPDANICASYYGVSDFDALRAFLHIKKTKQLAQNGVTAGGLAGEKKPAKNYRNFFLRNIVWQSMQWWTKDFDSFLNTFRPEVVLLQAGDAPFMYKIARRVAQKCRAKLVMFNTENYVLKKRLYAPQPSDKMFWHNLQMSSLRHQYQKFMNRVDFCIYSTEYLEQIYQERYPHPGKSVVFYTGTQMQDCSLLPCKENRFSLVYCGNLGVGRAEVLCEISDVLKRVDSEAKLIIYGKFPTEHDEQKVCSLNNVDYRGFVAYEEIPKALANASMVIHCENSARVENLKTAFSTKIADSLACGKPFLVYASREYPFVQYLERNQAAHVAENEQELETVLRNCMADKAHAERFIRNAKKTATENHNAEKNSQRLKEIVCS